jgi:hypothetical protein
MKRPHVILYLFLAGVSQPSFNQTIDIEKDNLMEKYLAGEFTQLQFKEASFLLRDLLFYAGVYDPGRQDEKSGNQYFL